MAGLGLLVAALGLRSLGPSIYNNLAQGMTETLSGLAPTELTVDTVGKVFEAWALILLRVAVPISAVILVVGVAVGLMQTQLLFSTKGITPDLSRMNPLQGFARIFSTHTLVDLAKALLKLGLVGYIAYQDIAEAIPQIPGLLGQNVATGVTGIASKAVAGLQSIGFGLLAIGILDYGYQWWEFRKSVRMTKQEVKQEHKEQEGNPELKQKQRQRARELARRRKALKDVPTADVVITNPTHFAVAIKYEAGKDAAPRVIAKGADLLAMRMKVIAKQHEVPTVENRPLARALYATVDLGKSVPPELYQAVAEVLAFVYSLRRERRRQR